jgi:hypothetical protein
VRDEIRVGFQSFELTALAPHPQPRNGTLPAMSADLSGEITAIATAVLAVFAIVTAWYARRAFLKQAQEVRAIEQQVQDAQELTRQQAELLKVQSGQLELQRQQFDEQRKVNARQAEILDLQAAELRESLEERKRDAYGRKRAQASRVFIEEEQHSYISDTRVITGGSAWIKVTVLNRSDEPVYDAVLHWHLGTSTHGDPDPEPVGMLLPAPARPRRLQAASVPAGCQP